MEKEKLTIKWMNVLRKLWSEFPPEIALKKLYEYGLADELRISSELGRSGVSRLRYAYYVSDKNKKSNNK